MHLRRSAIAFICAVSAIAAGTVAVVSRLESAGGLGPTTRFLVLTGLMVASWSWPVLVYWGDGSESVQCDEAIVAASLFLLPPLGVITLALLGGAAGQLLRRQSPVKTVFNTSQIVCAVGAAAGLARLLTKLPTSSPKPTTIAALGGGMIAFWLVSSSVLAGILATSGSTTFRRALVDGAPLRLIVLIVGSLLGITSALAVVTLPAAIWVLPLCFIAVRVVISGHFKARHDRDRMLGLFEATLSIHKPLQAKKVQTELLQVARRLLRSPHARLGSSALAGELSSAVVVGDGPRYLSVSGRPHTEPFDAADRKLLDALAAVGQSALSHAELYAQVGRQSEELAAIMGSLVEGVIAFDATGQPTFINAAGRNLLALEQLDLGRGPATLPAAETLAVVTSVARRCLRSANPVRDDQAALPRADTRQLPVSYTCAPILDGDKIVGAVLVFRDITDRIAAERELAHHAFHDQLTGLPNRRLFLDRLDQAMRRGRRTGSGHAVLFADVDRFKLINDNLGHQCGDELLREIARRLIRVARPSDTIARFGGDEFTILLEDVHDLDTAETMAQRFRLALREPVRFSNGREVVATLSVGIATTEQLQAPDDVLHNADVAMYQAKAAGIGGVHRYDAAAMRARSAHRLDLENELRQALSMQALNVAYQPLVSTRTGTVEAVEALVRWQHPRDGVRYPSEFIPIAEESGLILPLGRAVLEEATSQVRRWEQEGLSIGVAVNLSPRQFQDPELVQVIRDALSISQLAPHRLCLEITETVVMADLDLTLQTLGQLRNLGVHLAIDDFGTGYSSLSYLKKFPVDVVKIDKAFIRDVDKSDVDGAIVSAIVGLADKLGIVTVAEGVENEGQLARLRELGCPLVQGFHVAKPVSAEKISRVLRPVVPLQRKRPAVEVCA